MISQVEKDTGDKLVDSFALDYLLSLVARQSNTWTEGAYAEKSLDSKYSESIRYNFVIYSVQGNQSSDNLVT